MTFKPVDTAIVMVVGPCIDDTDFKSLEEAIAYNAAGMDVSLIVEKTDGTTSVTAITLTTAGTSDWTHKDGGYYEIEVTAAQNAEEGIAYIRGICTGVLPFESPRYSIVKANVYDSLVKGTDVLQTDVTQLAGVAQSLTDLKDFADAGYDPATNKVQGVVLVDTTTANSDMVGTDGANTVVPDAAGVAPTAIEIRTEMDTNSTKMAPSQTLADYKATGFSVPNEYDTVIAALQTDLDNPSQYMADISALASAAALSTHDGKLDTVDALIDTLISRLTAARAGYLDNLSAGAVALASGVDLTKIHGTALTETIDGYLAAAFVKLFDVATPLLVSSDTMRGTDSAALAATALTDVTWTDAKAAFIDASIAAIPTTAMRGTDNAALAATALSDAVWADAKAAFLDHSIATVDTVADGIQSDLNNATDGLGALKALIDTVDGIVDNILLDTGTNGVLLSASATSAQLIDDNWDEILTGETHNIATSAGRRVREIGAFAIHSGTAQAGNSIHITLAATASAIDGIYNRNLLVIVGGTGAGQTRTIVDYDGTTKIALADREWRVSPDATSEYQITPDDTPLTVDHGLVQDATDTTITIRDYASSVDNTYLCNIVIILAGAGRGQARLVSSYNGTTKVITICGENWVTIPDVTSVYALIPYGASCVGCITDDALAQIVAANIAGIADGTYDLQEMMRIMFAALSGKSSGGGTNTLAFRDAADNKDRISETVDVNGNRTAVTRDGT